MRRFLYSLLLSLALCPLSAVALEPVNINTADAAALQQVNGIGASKANAIIEYRKANGPFATVDELTKVPGIGEKSLVNLKPQVTVGAGGTAPVTTAKGGKGKATK